MIPIAKPSMGGEEVSAVADVLYSGMLAQGENVARFEKNFAEYCSVAEAVAVNNGTAALHATLLALGVRPGDEVIVPDFTFFATASSVCMCGARPVFADVEERTFNVNPISVQECIGPKTRAVIGVHLFGQPFEVTPVWELCEDAKIPLIEDAAQAHGAEYHNKKAGGLGDAACFSFYPTKNMTTGEGGMVTTDNRDLAERIRIIINHGQSEKYLHSCLGFNYRMSDIGGAMGCVQLNKLDSFNSRRRAIARYYSKNIRAAGIIPPFEVPGATHVFHQYVLKVMENGPMTRESLSAYLSGKGIGNAVHYPIPLHRQPVFREIAGDTKCPVSARLADQVISIPVHPSVTDTERDYIVTILNEVK
ncbi:perosamine synthetase [Methanolinea mesophila]|uniref:DegT/DnrJ/EryC1/StrS family aminotransferase n=1 Tax=Methanolinea mesophila TaxID=547055 RepID=UPI001AE8EB75|nr:DegT/DnrJ/EryC1/StrS aminotransferase family protein [Methanolinea mesophila]MBP1928359.1 perosamine synthetase [Methanolinea mesophila]